MERRSVLNKEFKVGDVAVYPAHGVGKIMQIEEQEIAGAKLELYIVDFEKEKLITEEGSHRGRDKLQEIHDKFVAQMDELGETKQREIMEV